MSWIFSSEVLSAKASMATFLEVEQSESEEAFEWMPQRWRGWLEDRYELSGAQYQDLTSAITLHLNLPPSALVLDAGCGYGRVSLQILTRQSNLVVVGMDASDWMIREAQKISEDYRFFPVRGDLRFPPFRNRVCDVVICMGVIMHVDDDSRVVHELGRLVKPGGRLIFTYLNRFNPWSIPFTAYARISKPGGFTLKARPLSFFSNILEPLGFKLRRLHPGFLVSREAWIVRIRKLAKILDHISLVVKSPFGYEPVVEARRTTPP